MPNLPCDMFEKRRVETVLYIFLIIIFGSCSNASCAEDEPWLLYANGSIFGKSKDGQHYYIFDPYPINPRREMMFKFSNIEDLCESLPRISHPRLWFNYYYNEDIEFIPIVKNRWVVKLSEAEILKIEASCFSGKKTFKRDHDDLHPCFSR
ncbi:hypothetical protein [Persicirhabdus sediminis]|uniref:hypothetical protein n=1 Tax=Persicirhabdus sediminis TaxID=454144 RepID=UPI001F1B4F4A|nr:hypothetical protein [Persicirhabdus sediminis]